MQEFLIALRRIQAIANYYRTAQVQKDEMLDAFDGIMNEASEAIAKTDKRKGTNHVEGTGHRPKPDRPELV